MRLSAAGLTRVRHEFDNDDDAAVVPQGPVTLTIRSGNGTVLIGPITASPEPGGVFWVTLAPLGPLGAVSAEWTGTVDGIERTERVPAEVVGRHFHSIREARESDKQLADTTRIPSEDIRHYRDVVAGEFETISGRSFVPRLRSVDVAATGHDAQWLGTLDARTLHAVRLGTVELDVSAFRVDVNGVLTGLSKLTPGATITVLVEYGYDSPPDDVRRAALLRLRSLIAAERSGIPDRATTFEPTDGGTFRLALPGQGGFETGIPDVDAVLARYTPTVLYDVLGVAG